MLPCYLHSSFPPHVVLGFKCLWWGLWWWYMCVCGTSHLAKLCTFTCPYVRGHGVVCVGVTCEKYLCCWCAWHKHGVQTPMSLCHCAHELNHVVVDIVELHETMPYSLGMIWSSFLFLNLWSLVPSKCPHIIYDFGVESPKESIGELSFAIGTFSGDDIFHFSSMFRTWFHVIWWAQRFTSCLC